MTPDRRKQLIIGGTIVVAVAVAVVVAVVVSNRAGGDTTTVPAVTGANNGDQGITTTTIAVNTQSTKPVTPESSTSPITTTPITPQTCGKTCLNTKHIYYLNQLSNPQQGSGNADGTLKTNVFGEGFADQTTKMMVPYKANSVLYTKSNNLYSATAAGEHKPLSGPWDGSVSQVQYSATSDLIFINTGPDLWRWSGNGDPDHLIKAGSEVVFAHCEKASYTLIVDEDKAFKVSDGDTDLKVVPSSFKNPGGDDSMYLSFACSDNFFWAINEDNNLFRASGFNGTPEQVTERVSSISVCDNSDVVVLQKANAETASVYVSGTEEPQEIYDAENPSKPLATKSISCV